LSEDEIKKIWAACSRTDVFPSERAFNGLVKLALLTAQRREKYLELKWADISDGVWTVQRDSDRRKGTPKQLPLTPLCLSVLAERPRDEGLPIFQVVNMSRPKRLLDEASGVTGWTLHDLRRTARSLMEDLGVPYEDGEEACGRVTGSAVSRIYRRGNPTPRIGKALKILSDHIASLVTPPPSADVIRIKPAA
jgi:integrase